MKSFSLFVLLLAVPLCLCQDSTAPNCPALNVDYSGVAFDGSSLSVCARQGLQCCNEDYLSDLREEAREAILDAVEKEFSETVRRYKEFVDDVIEYFVDEFPNELLRRHFPGGGIFVTIPDDILDSVVEILSNAFTVVDSINPRELIDSITEQLFSAIVNGVAQGDQMKAQCLLRLVNNSIDQAALEQIIQDIVQFKRLLQTLAKNVGFLDDFKDRLRQFEPLEQCVTRLVQLAVCDRCTMNIPPLCTNVCGALMAACISPVFSGLGDEFDSLWSVTRQALSNVQTLLRTIFDQFRNDIVDFSAVAAGLGGCNIDLSGRKRRQTDDSDPIIPNEVTEELDALTGIFEYDSSGPRFCTDQRQSESECSETTDERACDDDDICTASCQCWDGSQIRDRDIDLFTGITIQDQVNNPVIGDIVTTDELIAAARELGTPVNDYLTSETFSETVPDGVEVPPAAPFSGGVSPTLSLTALIATSLAALCYLLG